MLLSGTRAVTAPGTARAAETRSASERCQCQWHCPGPGQPALEGASESARVPRRISESRRAERAAPGFRAQVASGGSARETPGPHGRSPRQAHCMPRRHWHGSLRGQPDPGRSNWLRIVRRTQEPGFHRAAKIVYKRGKMDPTRSRRFVANVVCATNHTYVRVVRNAQLIQKWIRVRAGDAFVRLHTARLGGHAI
jgi:hypothetical protein